MSRLTGCVAAVVVALGGGAGTAAAEPAVHEATGPVAFANPTSLEIVRDGESGADPARLITETQRSPLRPGESRLDQSDLSVVPPDGGDSAVAPHYRVNLGEFRDGESPYPPDVVSRAHEVVAALGANHVPSASAETNYAVRYVPTTSTAADERDARTMLAIRDAHSSVACSGPNGLESRTTGTLLLPDPSTGELEPVRLTNGRATREDLPFGPPGGAVSGAATSEITVRSIDSFDALLRQQAWRDGPHTAAAGWRVEIVTRLGDEARGETRLETGRVTTDGAGDTGSDGVDDSAQAGVVRTTIVLGGVSCSVPNGFTPEPDGRAAAESSERPAVPMTVPAGGVPPAGTARDRSTVAGTEDVLVAIAGVTVGAAIAVLGVRLRRRSDTSRSR